VDHPGHYIPSITSIPGPFFLPLFTECVEGGF
jgi:hypothetical protein